MFRMIIVIILIGTFSYAKMFNVVKFSKKLTGKNLYKVTEIVKNSNFTKNLPNIKLSKAIRPEISTLITVANKIAKRGVFEDKLITTTLHPTDILRQYAKYGDKYLDTMKHFNKRVVHLDISKFKILKEKFHNMPNIKFNTSKEFNDKFVKALRYTGKKGWKTSQELARLAKKYPKSSIVSGMLAWYVMDPNGFLERKKELFDYMKSTLRTGVSDMTELTLDASTGVIDGFIKVFKEKATVSNIVLLLVILFVFILWKFRLYIKRLFLKKNVSKNEKLNNNSYNFDEEEGTF